MKKNEKKHSLANNIHLKERHLFVYDAVGRLSALLLMIFGVACVLWTKQIYQLLPFLLGITMAAIGLNNAIFGIWTRELENPETKITANGIVYFVLGIVILCHNQNADIIIGSIWGILGLMKGTDELNAAICQATQKQPFIQGGLRAALELLLGIMLLLIPDSALRHHIFLLGFELILTGSKLFRESTQTESMT